MKNRFYMKEFQYHDGECYVTFNIVDLNELKNEISVAICRSPMMNRRIFRESILPFRIRSGHCPKARAKSLYSP